MMGCKDLSGTETLTAARGLIRLATRTGELPHMALRFLTMGHSTRPLSEFASLLKAAGAQLVADVRTVPRSRTNPQYNIDILPAALHDHGIGYEHIPELGGLRSKQRDVPADVNGFWQNQSFHNYADYAMGERFHQGLKRLLELGGSRHCAIMCAELLWWRCHRRIITDYLLALRCKVDHIMGPGEIEPAHLTSAAQVSDSGHVTYPAPAG